MIYVTLGTMYLDFARLVRKMDAIAERTGERVVIQIGLCRTLPEHAEYFDFKPREEVEALIRDARLVVSHAGIGTVIDVLRAERPLVVVPRMKQFGEHNNDHQMDLARAVEQRGWGRMVLEIDKLDEVCEHPPASYTGYRPASASLIATVRNTIETVVARPQL